MLNNIIWFSIKNKFIVGLGVLALILYGSYQLTQLPIDAVPDITDNQVQVITVSPALGAPDVERLITFPIEQANSNIPGLKQIRSFSRFGLSVVTIVFHDNVDVYWARQQVGERLQVAQNDIPDGLGSPKLAPVTTGLGEIYQYVLRAKPGYESRYTATELRTVQDWIVRRQLLSVKGVADVSSFGGFVKQYQINVNGERLKANGLTINEVFVALENNNQNTGGAYIEKGPVVLFIRSEGLIGQLSDIENIVVKTTLGGIPIRIGDIGEVGFGSANRYGAVCYNDDGETVGAVLMMLKGENSSAVIKEVKKRIEQIKKTLPEGVEIEPFLDRTKMVDNAIHTVAYNLAEGALIVLFVLVLFLGNLRAGLAVASVIPLSMLFAVIMMNMFGVSGNLMSLGAIDFGLIVDGAVIIVEAVLHRLAHIRSTGNGRLAPTEMDQQVGGSASKMMNAAVFGQIIILVVYLPIFTLEGIEGKMFKPMAQTVAFALLGAFLLSVTYVPMISTLLLDKKTGLSNNLSDRAMAWIEKIYLKILRKALAFKWPVIGATLAAFVGAVLLFGTLGGEFIPELEEGDFAVDTRVLTGSNLNTTVEATQQAAHILLENFPEVKKVVTKIGSGEIPTDPMPIEASDMMVILKDKKEWTSARTFDELAEKMSAALQAVPGITAGFQYPVQMRFNELMTGARQDVVCKVFGEDLDSLTAAAARLGEVIGTVEGAKDLYVETVTGMPQIVVRYNRPALAQYGLSVSDVNRVVNASFAGAVAGTVYEGEKRFDLTVKFESAKRTGLADVQQLLIATADGTQIPLSHLAEVSIEDGPAQIQRENALRRITVGFNVRGRDVQTVVRELQQKVEAGIKLPSGYYIVYGGSFENLQQAQQRLGVAVPISLALIFLLLYFAFGSVRQGLLINSAIPLSAIGGILALWLRDMPFSISAGIGFIALFGVAVLNGIVLITEFNRLREEGSDDITDIVLKGTRTRLRPVLMTAAVASLGFIPMAFSNGAGAEVQRPLATVVIGGLFSATLLTLFVLPVLFVLFEKKKTGLSKKAAVLLLLALPLGEGLSAQTPIPLPAAIDSAWRQHPSLRPLELEIAYQKALRPSGRDIAPTDFGVEVGQFNTINVDYKLFAEQRFALPELYRKQTAVFEKKAAVGEKALENQRFEIAYEVKVLYVEMQSLAQQEAVWQRADSLFAGCLVRAEARFRAGETDLLEKTNAEIQLRQVRQRLASLAGDRRVLAARLQALLGTRQAYGPVAEPLELHFDTTLKAEHPVLRLQQSRIDLAQSEWEAAKAQRLPQFTLGISAQSIVGIMTLSNGQDEYFGPSPRFVFVKAGVSVPIFDKALRAQSEAAALAKEKEAAQWEAARFELRSAIAEAFETYRKAEAALELFRTEMQPRLDQLVRSADAQLEKGQINYLEWALIAQQNFELQLEQVDNLRQLNRAALQLHYLSAQPQQ